MDSPALELKLMSATDLKKSNPFSSTLQPYVVVSISGGGASFPSQKTPVDAEGGRNPTWNHLLTFSIPSNIPTHALTVKFQIRSRRTLAADKLIGEVCVPLRDLLRSTPPSPSAGKASAPATFVSYQVKKPSGRPKGVLTFSYRFKASGAAAEEEPVMAYPAKPHTTTAVYPTAAPANLYPPSPPPSAPPAMPPKPQPATGYPAVDGYKYDVYPPPPNTQPTGAETSYGYPAIGGYGYGYPVQTGYGYPGQTGYGCGPCGNGYGYGYGYGYSGQVVQPRRKNNSGLGLGAGLLGGALAGMVVGDLVSDAVFDF